MKLIENIRNSLYGILMLVVSIGTVVAFLCFSTNTVFFGTNTNFSIMQNNSGMNTKELDNQLENIANQDHVVIAKRVYIQNGDTLKAKYAVLGKNEQYIKGLPTSEIERSENVINSNMMTDYAVFGPGDQHNLIRYLQNHDIDLLITQRHSFKNNAASALDNLSLHFLDKLLWSVILVLIVINGFIIFRRTKRNALLRLLEGKRIYQVILLESWKNVKFLIYSTALVDVITFALLWILAPYILVIAMQCIIVYELVILFSITAAVAITVLLFNATTILATLKGKVSGFIIPLTSVAVMAVTFLLFTNILSLSQDNQRQINRLNDGESRWEKIDKFNNLLFHYLPSGTSPEDVQANKKLSDTIHQNFREKDTLFSALAFWRSPKITLGLQGKNQQNIYTNTTYFKYQNVKDIDGKTISPSDFTSPVTILTTRQLSNRELMDNFATPLGLTNLDNVETRLIKPSEVYVYINSYDQQDQAFQKPDQIMVLNFDKAENIPSQDILTDVSGNHENIITSNIPAWSSQNLLRFKIDSASDKDKAINMASQYVSEITSATRIRYELKNHAKIDQTVLRISLVLSFSVMLITGYFMTYIVMLAYRKKLFIQALFGMPFWRRYRWIYIGFILSLLPGIISSTGNPGTLPWVLIAVVALILIFTIQIRKNEKQHYAILKGDL
ncbi:DUF1430 domain-containing protein [Lactobacillaceae bacterium L1_55_11]|nr:DUF1430 domain-containing protein [Lactobacillaceae bacterium L1_55_11]